MGKHLQKWGFTPDYTVWTFHGESAQCARAEVLRRRTDKHGNGMQDMVQDFDDARDSDDEMEESAKAFNEMLESSERPLHEHTELCQLDAISQIMALKAQFNLGRECYDAIMTIFGLFYPKAMYYLQTCTSQTKFSVLLRCPMRRYMPVRKDVPYLGFSMRT